MKPEQEPQNKHFSSGPTRKHPSWKLESLDLHSLGRSHRSTYGLERIRYLVNLMRQTLKIPHTYKLALIPGSCTAAMEAALWGLLGPRPVDFISFDVFGHLWVKDGLSELKLKKARVFEAPPGEFPDLSDVHPSHDVVLTWNGTTAGVRVPNSDWITPKQEGLVICDATSALFGMEFPWEKMDAVAFSWQKGLGGEGGHGMLALSPRAIERLNEYTPKWPIPRVLRLTYEGKFAEHLFDGMTLNTPSFLCIEDAIEALTWVKNEGGLPALIQKSEANLKAIETWVDSTPWIDFLAEIPSTRSSTSICLKFPEDPHDWGLPKAIAALLEKEKVAYDILGYIRSAPSLRIWGGPTIETQDIEDLLPWITWAYHQVRENEISNSPSQRVS